MIQDFARRVIDDFGDQTDSYVASRIGVLIRDGDSYGVRPVEGGRHRDRTDPASGDEHTAQPPLRRGAKNEISAS